ncbi:MAG: ribosomal protein methyltransferase [Solirubrobacteraceae bacterium]|nr:ribosomal protein methyltransferase [Solirubrobacteraceae bacterium]
MIRLALRVRRADAELVLAELLELVPDGVEEVQVDASVVEYAVYGAPGELPRLPALNAAVGDALVEVSTTEVRDDWHERWREFHKAVLIEAPPLRSAGEAPVPALIVRPPWEPARDRPARELQEIVIDPGLAFGTGGHASTRTCLALLLELARERASGPLLDVGTGSGVLAIAAKRLGFGPVLALDNERESVHAARENARANGVDIVVRRLDLRSEPLPWDELAAQAQDGQRLIVLANLLRPLLLELADAMPSAPAHLLAGGLLGAEADEVAGAFRERLGLYERARRESGEWATLWLASG